MYNSVSLIQQPGDIAWAHLFAQFLKSDGIRDNSQFVVTKGGTTVASGYVSLLDYPSIQLSCVAWTFARQKEPDVKLLAACPRSLLEKLGCSSDDSQVLYGEMGVTCEQLLKLFLEGKSQRAWNWLFDTSIH